jgi:hypothetical protein
LKSREIGTTLAKTRLLDEDFSPRGRGVAKIFIIGLSFNAMRPEISHGDSQ